MGRIITQVRLENGNDPSKHIECSALVDTGTTFVTLPRAWRDQLGEFSKSREVGLETATQAVSNGELCGPALIAIEGFMPTYSEILFIDMVPENGIYEPFIGYIPLEQSLAGIDMVGHRLVHVKNFDLK